MGQQSKVASKLSGSHRSGTRNYENSNFRDHQHFRSPQDGRSLQLQSKHRYSSSEVSQPSYNSFSNPRSNPDKSSEEFDTGLVPVFLTPHKSKTSSLQNKPHFISYISPGTKFNYQSIIPVVNVPLSPNYYYQTVDDVPESVKPAEKIVKSRPHYVLDSYSYRSRKPLVPIHQKTKPDNDQFHDLVQNPQVASALHDNQEQTDGRYQEITSLQHEEYGSKENTFSNVQDLSDTNGPSDHLQQVNVLLPPAISHNTPPPPLFNQIKQDVPSQLVTNPNESPENKNIHYQLINSFNNLHKENQQIKPSEEDNVEHRNNYNFQNSQFHQIRPEYQQQQPQLENYDAQELYPNNQQLLGHLPVRDQQVWQNPADSSVKVLGQENERHNYDNGGVQYIRGGLNFEVIKDKSGISQQSRGEIGQKSLDNSNFDGHHQNSINYERPSTEVGSKHLNQVLHYIEPHEMVQQISTAPSIENEYPSLETVPETSFVCRGLGRTMLPDPETSCQVVY